MTMQDLKGNKTARWLSVLALVGTAISLVSSNWSTVWGTLESWGVPEAAETAVEWVKENKWSVHYLPYVVGWYTFAYLLIRHMAPKREAMGVKKPPGLLLASPLWMPFVAATSLWDALKGRVSRAEVPRLVDNVRDIYEHSKELADVPNVVKRVDQHLERLTQAIRTMNESVAAVGRNKTEDVVRANNILTNLAQLLTQVKDIRTPVADSHSTVHLIQVRDKISQLMPLLDVIKGHLGRPIPVDWKGQDEFMATLKRIEQRPNDGISADLVNRVNSLIEKVESGLDEGKKDEDDATVELEFFDESWEDAKENYEGKTPTWKMLEAMYWEGAYDGVNEKVSSKHLKEMYVKLENLRQEVEAGDEDDEKIETPTVTLRKLKEWWEHFEAKWGDKAPTDEKVKAAFWEGLYMMEGERLSDEESHKLTNATSDADGELANQEDEEESPPQPQPKPLNVLDEFEEWWDCFQSKWSDVVPDQDKVEAAFFEGVYQVADNLHSKSLIDGGTWEQVAKRSREADKKLRKEMLSKEDIRQAWEALKSSSPATKIAVNLTAMEEAFYSGVATGQGNQVRPADRNEFERHRQRLMAMRVGESEPVKEEPILLVYQGKEIRRKDLVPGTLLADKLEITKLPYVAGDGLEHLEVKSLLSGQHFLPKVCEIAKWVQEMTSVQCRGSVGSPPTDDKVYLDFQGKKWRRADLVEGVYLDAEKRISVKSFPSKASWIHREERANYVQIRTEPPLWNESSHLLSELQEAVEKKYEAYQLTLTKGGQT